MFSRQSKRPSRGVGSVCARDRCTAVHAETQNPDRERPGWPSKRRALGAQVSDLRLFRRYPMPLCAGIECHSGALCGLPSGSNRKTVMSASDQGIFLRCFLQGRDCYEAQYRPTVSTYVTSASGALRTGSAKPAYGVHFCNLSQRLAGTQHPTES